jgi:Protein of unknown function (DUF3147)
VALGTIAVKFAIGGVFVALFALAGEIFRSKRFSGVLGGAPAVATASLLVTVLTTGTKPIREMMMGMVFGAAAFLVYVNIVRGPGRRFLPSIAAPPAWLAWFVTTAVLLWAGG